MKKLSVLLFIVAMALGAAAQEIIKPDTDTAKPLNYYKVDFAFKELQDGKVVNTRTFTMLANTEKSNTLKIGSRVPVAVGGEKGIQYMDVGVNIFCRLEPRADLLAASINIDSSSIAGPDQLGAGGQPIVRNMQTNVNTALAPGKPTVIATLADTTSNKSFQIEVTATKQK